MAIPTDHIYHYTMDNVLRSSLFEEGDGPPGEMLQCSVVDGKFGKSIAIGSGAGAQINLGNLDPTNFSQCAHSVWVNFNSATRDNLVFTKRGFVASSPLVLWRNFESPDYYSCRINASGYLNSTSVPATGSWEHIVVNFVANDRMEMYVNSVLETTLLIPTIAAPLADSSGFVIGGATDYSDRSLDGKIDQARFYDRILTQSEITELFNEPSYELTGTITETLPIGGWRVIVSAISDGRVIGSTTVVNGIYSIGVPYWDAEEMYTLTCVPEQGSKWIASTAVIINQLIIPPDAVSIPYYYKVTVVGTSGASEPVWATTPGNTFTDGTATLECVERLVQPQIHGPVVATAV